jgi:chloramphenicol 3-O phosphotransferase
LNRADVPHPLVVITGGSGSGKSTLARTLQARWLPAQWLHFSPDTVLHCLPQAVVDGANLRNDWSAIDRPLLRRSTLACLRALLEAGHPVLFDCVIMTERAAQELVAGLHPHVPYLVRLVCSWQELQRRTLARGDRTLQEVEHGFNSAAAQHLRVDCELDTTARSPGEIADALIAALARQSQPSAWADNRARYAAAP